MSASKSADTFWSTAFASGFGLLLGLALLKFGNPIILDRLIDPPSNVFEFAIQPWPVRWGYLLLLGCVGLGLPGIGVHTRVLKWVLVLPCLWFGWQLASASHSIDQALTRSTLIHFAACLGCFLLGLFGPWGRERPFWLCLLGAFGLVLWTGFEQHYGGLEATRQMFYEQPNWQQFPPEYLKKIQSNRIFSTLVYPNALAAALLLLLPAMLVLTWQVSHRLTNISRAVIVGVLAYAGLACLYWSGSKSGWLIALIAVLLAVLRQPLKKQLRLAIVGMVLVAGLAAFFVKYSPYFRRGAPSVSARMEYWKAAWRTALDNPLFGTGPGTFSVAYRKIKPPEAEMAQLTHNDYLEQASDSGWVGALAYTSFVFGSVLWLPRQRRIFDSHLRFAVWLGLVAWALQSSVEFLLYIPGLAWTALALCGWLWAGPPQSAVKAPVDTPSAA